MKDNNSIPQGFYEEFKDVLSQVDKIDSWFHKNYIEGVADNVIKAIRAKEYDSKTFLVIKDYVLWLNIHSSVKEVLLSKLCDLAIEIWKKEWWEKATNEISKDIRTGIESFLTGKSNTLSTWSLIQ